MSVSIHPNQRKLPNQTKYRIKEDDLFFKLQEKRSFFGIRFWWTIETSFLKSRCERLLEIVVAEKKTPVPKNAATYYDDQGKETLP